MLRLRPARVTRGGLNAGDLSSAEGTGTSLVQSMLPQPHRERQALSGFAGWLKFEFNSVCSMFPGVELERKKRSGVPAKFQEK